MTTPPDVVEVQGAWVSPSGIVEYLRRQGWQDRGGREGFYARFRPPIEKQSHRSVTIPLNPDTADFRHLLEDAIASLAAETGLGDQRLLIELDLGVGDTIRFRKEMPSPHGSIPWLAGEALVTSSTKLLEAAAKAERERARYYGNKHWTSAKAYLDEVRMGQTEVGSYIVTALTPIGELTHAEVPLLLPELGDPSSGRAVTSTLVTALEATKEAVDHFNHRASLDAFDDAVQYGVSFELMRALGGLVSNSDGADVRIEWNQRQQPPSDLPAIIEFEPSALPALERASMRFAQTEPPRRVTVVGTVTLLERPRLGAAGVIRLEVIEGSQAKKLRVRLPEEMYESAIRAHREGMGIKMSGRQEKEGRLYWLYDPFDLELVEVPQLPSNWHPSDEEDDNPLF